MKDIVYILSMRSGKSIVCDDTVNGTIAGQNADGDISYFTTDLLGSVRTTTDGYGYVNKNYTYDVFGAIIEGDLSGEQNYGYLGKQFDKQTGLYNYGYRDYTPKVARFTTVDPIRDGENWVTYCNNDSVNQVDMWGLESSDSNNELINYILLGKNMGETVCPTVNILLKFSNNNNSNGATKGTLTVYWADDKDVDLDLFGTPVLTVPIVSGNTNDSQTPFGTYKNLSQEKTSTSTNDILKDNAHGGENNIMIRLPNTGGDAIHQGNNMATIDSAYTNGCSAITAYELNIDSQTGETDVDRNYKAFKQSLTPYGYEGVKPNVYVW